MRRKLLLLSFLMLLVTLSTQAQTATPTPPELTSAENEIITGLTITLNGLLLGGAILLATVIYALYNSVPPTFQTAFLEALRGVVAITEDTLQKRALDAKLTPSDLDDRIIEAVNKAVAELAKQLPKGATTASVTTSTFTTGTATETLKFVETTPTAQKVGATITETTRIDLANPSKTPPDTL